MGEWKALLKKDRTRWLLEEDEPSVRYWTLKWLLDLYEDDPKVVAAREAVEASLPVRRLFAAQRPEGYWGAKPAADPGTRRELHLLLWLGDPGGPGTAAAKATAYLADGCLDEAGAYRYEMEKTDRAVLLPCHGAELAGFMLRFGLARDPRFRKLIDWLLSLRKEDGSLPCPSKVGVPSCLFATALFLRLEEELRECGGAAGLGSRRAAEIREAADGAAHLFLAGGFARAARNRPSERWFAFGFPLQWESDVLEVLRLVAPFSGGIGDPRLAEALELVLSKQGPDGTWPCEKWPKGGKWMRRYVEFEPLGASSKWVTLAAYRALKALARPTP